MPVYKPVGSTFTTYCNRIHYNLLPTGAQELYAHPVLIILFLSYRGIVSPIDIDTYTSKYVGFTVLFL